MGINLPGRSGNFLFNLVLGGVIVGTLLAIGVVVYAVTRDPTPTLGRFAW